MADADPKPLPSVFDYEDYRAFLRDHYAARKRGDRRFSYGAFALRAGVPSRMHLKMVIDGKRGLSPDYVRRYAKGLRLDAAEGEHFALLVQAAGARSPGAREAALAEIRGARLRRACRALGIAESEALSRQWLSILLLAMDDLRDFRRSPRWVGRRLLERRSASEIRAALSLLEEAGLLERSGGGRPRSPRAVYLQDLLRHDKDRLRERFLRAALGARGARRGGGSSEGFNWAAIAMTPKQASELQRKHFRWLQENLPVPAGKVRRGEVYAVIGDVFPLTAAPACR